jgi:kumamolisin
MDLEVVHAIAPGARLVLYNQDQAALAHAATSDHAFLDALVSFQDRIVSENPRGVISESIGACETGLGSTGAQAYEGVFAKADELGEAVFAASGDSGAFGCLASMQGGTPSWNTALGVSLPAAIPGITAVGGTRLSVRTDGSWYDETAWIDPTSTAGTGGGLSAYFPRPGWQNAPGTATGASASPDRAVPDVSADADPASGAALVLGGHAQQGGGTSQAAPIWAGITVLVNQYLQRQGLGPVGFMNPALYRLAATRQPYAPFHDVTRGSNLVNPAGPGYDLATGLGSPDVWNLARDLAAYEKAGRP